MHIVLDELTRIFLLGQAVTGMVAAKLRNMQVFIPQSIASASRYWE